MITLGSERSIVTDEGCSFVRDAGRITGATFGLTFGGSGNGSVSSIIGTTSGTVTKNGAGAWTLSGANTFTGGTTLSIGTLNINNSQALGTVAATFTISGGTINHTTARSLR